ncbi:MAG TPA: HAMP domain-containing sensor histidine kinase [Afifellaceae bacterium]|nr:HAMP domain-containing sensor histidine kinase [Afifellaceae bacterium]
MAESDSNKPPVLGRLRSALRPRLRTILIGLNLSVLILPLGSIFFFRIYENQLVQETERELIAQAAFIAAVYEREIRALGDGSPYGRRIEVRSESKKDTYPSADSGESDHGYYTPVDPELDLAAVRILPPRPPGYDLGTPADPIAQVAGASLTPILQQAQRTTLSGMRVLDFNGIVVAGGGEIGKSFMHVTEVQRALNGRYASVVRERFLDQIAPPVASISRGTGIRVFIVLPVVSEDRILGFVYLSRTPKSILKHMHAEREKVIFAGLTIVGLSILLAFLTSSRIVRPINQLIERTHRLAAGDKSAMEPLERPGTREMTQLSQSFTRMASALQERSDYIRDFAAHVSHEFKTPLASIGGAVELLRDHGAEMSDTERDRFLDNIAQDTERLRRLVTRLLELARVDNLEPTSDTLDVAATLNGIRSGFSTPAFGIEVDAPRPLMAAISRDGLEMIVSNLADNSRQHGARRMRISASNGDGIVELRIADDGEGISPANRRRIFTPFFTTRREDGGTGLGLGIVSSILDAHGGSIELGDGTEGAEFIVRLKQAA